MQLQESKSLNELQNEVQQVETNCPINQFEIIQNSLYYLENNKLVIYDLEKNVISKEFKFNYVLSAFVVNGNNIYLAKLDSDIIQFNAKTEKKKIITHCQDSAIKKMAVFNHFLIYLKYDLAQLCIIDLNTKKSIRKIQCFEDYGWDLKISFQTKKLIAVTYADWVYQGVKIYDIENLSLFSYFKSEFYYSLVEFSNDQEHIFIADITRVRQYNIRTKELIFQLSDAQIYGMYLYQSQLMLLKGQKIQFINFENKHETRELILQNQLIYVDKDLYSSNEFINFLRVNEKYLVWQCRKQEKGFHVLRKF